MSDCATVIFHSQVQKQISPAVYLHWHGGCVLVLLETAMERMRTSDAGYSCARFIGRCHEVIPDNTSLGVYNLPGDQTDISSSKSSDAYNNLLLQAEKFHFGGRGTYLVDVDEWRVRHTGSTMTAYGDTGDGFGMQEQTDLRSVDGIVQLPIDLLKSEKVPLRPGSATSGSLPADIQKLLGTEKRQVHQQLGKPDKIFNGSDAYFRLCLMVFYDSANHVYKLATIIDESKSGYGCKILGISPLDSEEDCVNAWGKPSGQYLQWQFQGHDLDLEMITPIKKANHSRDFGKRIVKRIAVIKTPK
jgi:hypothetical protein